MTILSNSQSKIPYIEDAENWAFSVCIYQKKFPLSSSFINHHHPDPRSIQLPIQIHKMATEPKKIIIDTDPGIGIFYLLT